MALFRIIKNLIMRTEDLFKYGVTPIKGPRAGERFDVDSIGKDVIYVRDSEGICNRFEHGSYKVWEKPKTLFEDDSIKPTWGNLKRAMAARGLSDDTLFISDPTTFDPFTLLDPSRRFGARFRVVKHVKDGGDFSEDEIIVY